MLYRSPFVLAICLLTANSLVAQDAATSHDEIGSAIGSIKVVDPDFTDLIDPNEKIEVLSNGHKWTEGPVWAPEEGCLLFSDIPHNNIHRWSPTEGVSVFMHPSGFDGDNGEAEPGSNGLLIDHQGRLMVCDHGNRRVYRVESDGTKTTLADRYEGKRLNSPNDLVESSAGDIYFTDPPYGIHDKSKRELDFCGVYRISPDGTVTLMTKELAFPNGIGLSPDEKTLYVAQSDGSAPIYMAYTIQKDGTIDPQGKRLYDATELKGDDSPGGPDGFCVDVEGNLWASGPGGVIVVSPKGKLLGRIMLGKPTANCTFGGEDGKTLFITSSDRLCRVKTKTQGFLPAFDELAE